MTPCEPNDGNDSKARPISAWQELTDVELHILEEYEAQGDTFNSREEFRQRLRELAYHEADSL